MKEHDLELNPTAFCDYLPDLSLQERCHSRMSTARPRDIDQA